MSRVYSEPTAELDSLLHDNMTVAAGGFGSFGIPENLIAERRTGEIATDSQH